MQRRFSVLVLAGVLAVAALFAPASAAAYSGADFRKPTDFRGGSWLGQNTQQHNSREPINVVISAKSDKRVRDNPGDYLLALTFSDCFGGQVVRANVDGSFKDQAFELRGGGCGEIFGGNHLRGWQQSGTGAWFLAVSEEHGFPWDHHIDSNGFNKGRDDLARSADGIVTERVGRFGYRQFKTTEETVRHMYGSSTGGGNTDNVPYDGTVIVLTVQQLTP